MEGIVRSVTRSGFCVGGTISGRAMGGRPSSVAGRSHPLNGSLSYDATRRPETVALPGTETPGYLNKRRRPQGTPFKIPLSAVSTYADRTLTKNFLTAC